MIISLAMLIELLTSDGKTYTPGHRIHCAITVSRNKKSLGITNTYQQPIKLYLEQQQQLFNDLLSRTTWINL